MPVPRPAPGTGKWWALGIAFALSMTAFFSWRVLSVADEQITARTLGFAVVDTRTTTIDFEVTRPPTTTVVCTVQAQDIGHGVVGSAQVTLAPGGDRIVRQSATIRTTTKAVAALVHDCVRA